ncbi:MAG: potassium-transporting ATPase subunit KdpA [Bdellovibrionales bacterium]
MTQSAWITLLALFASVSLLAFALQGYFARALAGEKTFAAYILLPLERLIYAIIGVKPDAQQSWRAYAGSLLLFNAAGILLLFALLITQGILPLNPQRLPGIEPGLAFNIAVAFVTNTDWQAYAGETTLSYLSQMLGPTTQGFLSAATGLAVMTALARGLAMKEAATLGHFYVDLTRATLYVLLPFALIFAIALIALGVPENLSPSISATTLEGATQTIAQGPVASLTSIKILGSNGGGFFNANGAHPYENPSPLSAFIQIVLILALPFALVLAFGRMIGDRKQGLALACGMAILFLSLLTLSLASELQGSPILATLGIDQNASDLNPGGSMEGKETRLGLVLSTIETIAATATSNGTAMASIESLTPLSGMAALFGLLTGGIAPGGIGCGVYGIFLYVLLSVFIAGLMVGRAPEYLGKKIEAYEIKLAVIAQLLYPLCVLGLGALALTLTTGIKSLSEQGPHGLTQMLYAYASAAANNGSAFAGLNANTAFLNLTLAATMLIGRYGIIIVVLAIAGSLAAKRKAIPSPGTLPTHSPTFVAMLICVILMFGGLSWFPALALGPIGEHLSFSNASALPTQ